MSDAASVKTGRSDPEGGESAFSGTRYALRAVVGRRDALAVTLAFGVSYLVVYLATVGDLSLGGTGALTVRTVDDISLAVQGTGFFRFEAIALLQVGGVSYLFSPLNLAVGATLATLVAANAGVSYLALVQPRACGLEATSGAFASFPALLSGAACCGPTVLLLIGVQASATIVTGFQLLVPLAVLLLVASLLLVGRTVEPSLLNGT
ncbi:hypothetical protein Halar_1292 [halophilic archaeon DL31]|jgi:hypothetical protein|nr:hypothetical protein Halar_1292 [halophilic archaeon DL31]